MSSGYIRVVVALLVSVPLAACQHGETAAALPVIDWHTSALDLNLRGMNGQSYLFRCPVGKPTPEAVTGSGVYTDASSICAAAAHAGELDASRGGLVMIQILPGQSHYRGTMQNFIPSQGYTQPWGGSFAVLSPANFHAEEPRADR